MFPNPFHQAPAPWGKLQIIHDEDAMIILDGRQIRLKELSGPVKGKVAYVGGIHRKSFARFCALIAAERMDFYEMRVDDLSALRCARGLCHLAIRWNTKLQDAAPLAKLKLRTLILEQTPRLRDLTPVGRIRELEYFEFAGGWSSANVANSLAPLAQLPKLTRMSLVNVRVKNGGLVPLSRCRKLQKLEVSNQFPTEEYAFLSVRLPKTRCRKFSVWVKSGATGKDDVMIVGSRKPFLNSKLDREKIKRYEREFDRLRSRFASDKSLQPSALRSNVTR